MIVTTERPKHHDGIVDAGRESPANMPNLYVPGLIYSHTPLLGIEHHISSTKRPSKVQYLWKMRRPSSTLRHAYPPGYFRA